MNGYLLVVVFQSPHLDSLLWSPLYKTTRKTPLAGLHTLRVALAIRLTIAEYEFLTMMNALMGSLF